MKLTVSRLEQLIQEAEIKKQLMAQEFEYNMQLKGTEVNQKSQGETEKEVQMANEQMSSDEDKLVLDSICDLGIPISFL